MALEGMALEGMALERVHVVDDLLMLEQLTTSASVVARSTDLAKSLPQDRASGGSHRP